ncbi:MAG: hypothetical protein K2G28_01185 [Acetatifactor sp.]|nr:hypothetical protein [Acetatifactor sp.]MDE7352886.1 hypothetical protein [Acetatifactor sp.]
MQLIRIFSTAGAKGTEGYIRTQKKYEVIRTLLYFAVSLSLYVAGYIQTGQRTNLLTIVAVLGCLPASKSAVSAVMFLRARGCGTEAAREIQEHSRELAGLFDCVFTSYKKNFAVSHMAVRGNTVCGYTEDPKFQENEFYRHLGDILKLDGQKDVTVKVFSNLARYTERLEQMAALERDEAKTQAIIAILKSVSL